MIAAHVLALTAAKHRVPDGGRYPPAVGLVALVHALLQSHLELSTIQVLCCLQLAGFELPARELIRDAGGVPPRPAYGGDVDVNSTGMGKGLSLTAVGAT